MKKLKVVLVAFISLVALSACDNDTHISWSPDGRRMTVLAVGNSLRLANAEGKFSSIDISGVQSCQWFADNHHVLLLREKAEKRWSVIAPMLTVKERSEAIFFAERLRVGHGTASELEKKFKHINENGDLVLAYIYTRYGAKAVQDVFRNWQMKDLASSFSGVDISTLQIYDLSEDGSKATPGPVLFKSRIAIKSVKLSPNGKFIAISQSADSYDKISAISATSGSVKEVTLSSSSPTWSKDSQSIYFISPTQALPSNLSAIPLSVLSKIDIADLSGKFLPKLQAAVDLCKISPSGSDRIVSLSDGTLLICSKAITLPSIDFGGSGKQSLFKFDADKKSLVAIQLNDSSLSDSLDSFEVAPDGTKVVLVTKKNAIWVLDLNSGQSRLIQGEGESPLAFTPVWRSTTELCFPLRHGKSETQSGLSGHDFEVALTKVSDGDPTSADILSDAWSANQFKFLKVAPPKTTQVKLHPLKRDKGAN